MIHVVEVKPVEDFSLRVRFSDGLEGIYAVEPHRRGGVFDGLLDPATFNAVTINADFGCVEWPCGVDLCPVAMHQEIVAAKSRDTIAAVTV